ncbi:hypothetical protein, partial [Deinococcus sp. 12RED42]|uniref:hypothetical protein n=1 Tax=Deinococcus sp. 12RED42 TaxID=2745872 RepID=UPI001E3DDFE7
MPHPHTHPVAPLPDAPSAGIPELLTLFRPLARTGFLPPTAPLLNLPAPFQGLLDAPAAPLKFEGHLHKAATLY